MEEYKIIMMPNAYGHPVYYLIIGNINMGSIKPEKLAELDRRGIAHNDSKGIAEYLRYNSL